MNSRADAVRKHHAWLLRDPAKVLDARNELRGKRLGCWCTPLPCHGHTLALVANCSNAQLRELVHTADAAEAWRQWATVTTATDGEASDTVAHVIASDSEATQCGECEASNDVRKEGSAPETATTPTPAAPAAPETPRARPRTHAVGWSVQ